MSQVVGQSAVRSSTSEILPRCQDEPMISLVICTMGRKPEFVRCVESIIGQRYGQLEVIVVDQSDDERMLPIVESLRAACCRVEHVRASGLGASAARNVGARRCCGEII